MVRAFIGICLSEEIKSYVIGVQEQIKSTGIDAKFVEPENLHISLSFLGEIADAELKDVESKLDDISGNYAPFKMILGNLLFIPNEKFTRVVALGIKSVALDKLRKNIVKSIGGESNPGHLTLARVKNIPDKKRFFENAEKIDFKEVLMQADGVSLVESRLQKDGPVYSILHTSKFGS